MPYTEALAEERAMEVSINAGGCQIVIKADVSPTVLASDGVVLTQALGEVALGLWQQCKEESPSLQDGAGQNLVSGERAQRGYTDQYGFSIGQGQPLPVE